MARWSLFIEKGKFIKIEFNEEAPARDKKESGRPQKILDFIKRYVWPILFAVGASVIGSIIAVSILEGEHF